MIVASENYVFLECTRTYQYIYSRNFSADSLVRGSLKLVPIMDIMLGPKLSGIERVHTFTNQLIHDIYIVCI